MADLTLVSHTDTPAQVDAVLAARATAAEAEKVGSTAVVETPAVVAEPEPVADAQAEADKAASDAAKLLAERKNKAAERKGSIQAEIDALTRAKYDTAREVAAVEAKLAALKAEAEAAAAAPTTTAVTAKPAVADFADYDAYVEALADWKADQKASAAAARVKAEIEATLKARDEQAHQFSTQTQLDQVRAEFETRRVAFAAKTPDYADVMANVVDNPEQYAATPDMLLHIQMSPVGEELAYELAKLDPKEYRRIADLPLRPMLAQLGRLEGKIEDRSRQTTAATTGPVVTAPSKLPSAPPKPVGAGSSASTKPLAQVDNYEEYKRRRKAGEGR